MKGIPKKQTKEAFSFSFLLFLLLFTVNNISAQDWPLQITSTSEQGNRECTHEMLLGNVTVGKSILVHVLNNLEEPITIIDIDAGLTYALPNEILSIEYDDDGHAEGGYPIWNPGLHTVTLHLMRDIESRLRNNRIDADLTIVYEQEDTKRFEGSRCFRVLSDEDSQPRRLTASSNPKNTVKLLEEKTPIDNISGTVISIPDPILHLEVKNEEKPVTVYLAGITQPQHKAVVINNMIFTKGIHSIPLSDYNLTTGIYQIIIKQEKQFHTIKYFNSH